MSYYTVSLPDDSLPWYVWADNPQHAVRKIENAYGDATLNGRTRYRANQVYEDEVPTWVDVIDEPDAERLSRLDGLEE